MKRSIRITALSLSLALALCALAGPAGAQTKTELVVVLSSFSAETLDPVLQGHIVKYYLSLMFDYLVGTTPDGTPSRAGGLATKWENSADHKRWTFHLRKGVKFHNGDDVTSEDVKFSLQRAMGKRSTTGYAGPLRTLIQDIETPAPDRVVIVTKESTLIIPTYLSRVAVDRGHGAAEEVHRGQRRRRVRAQAGRQRPLQVRGAGDGLPHQADRHGQPLAHRHPEVQERCTSSSCPRRPPASRCSAAARWTSPTSAASA